MDKKIVVYIAIGVLVAILSMVIVLPNAGLKNFASNNSNTPSALTSALSEVKPLEMNYNGSSVSSITNRVATIETKFNLTNPNDDTLIIEMLSYDIYVNGVSIGHGQYGEKYEGASDSSTYLPLTQHNSEIITNQAQLTNDGNNPQIWSALQSGTAQIRINGTTYYSTHSPLAGQTYSQDFDFK